MKPLRSSPILVIVLAQLLGTSLWFSPNSAAASLLREWGLTAAELGPLTSATQFGFIAGTLLLATTGLADRFPASRIFALSCAAGALGNALFALTATGLATGMAWRFLVGLALAGIYPLGMKMIISWTQRNTGATLGLLVAMLTLGSALPHGVRAAGIGWPWESVVLTSSLLALLAGVVVYLLGEGPHLPPARRRAIPWGSALRVFLNPKFRASAFGYFGHMWELYAFWTLLPFLVAGCLRVATDAGQPALTSALTFGIMGVMGATGAILAGAASERLGSPRVAALALFTSGLMCLLFPLVPDFLWVLQLGLLVTWGLSVVADSAQFSATSAKVCPAHLVGGALALQNSLGFLLSTVSINLVMASYENLQASVAWLLLPGPILGLLCFRRLLRSKAWPGTTADR